MRRGTEFRTDLHKAFNHLPSTPVHKVAEDSHDFTRIQWQPIVVAGEGISISKTLDRSFCTILLSVERESPKRRPKRDPVASHATHTERAFGVVNRLLDQYRGKMSVNREEH